MPPKVLYNLKSLFGPVRTVEALKWQLVSVRQVVMTETCGPAECSLTFGANVRPILTVLSLVIPEQEARLKSIAALLANEGAHVSVTCLPVNAEGVGTVGAVVAVFT